MHCAAVAIIEYGSSTPITCMLQKLLPDYLFRLFLNLFIIHLIIRQLHQSSALLHEFVHKICIEKVHEPQHAKEQALYLYPCAFTIILIIHICLDESIHPRLKTLIQYQPILGMLFQEHLYAELQPLTYVFQVVQAEVTVEILSCLT